MTGNDQNRDVGDHHGSTPTQADLRCGYFCFPEGESSAPPANSLRNHPASRFPGPGTLGGRDKDTAPALEELETEKRVKGKTASGDEG